MKENFIFMVFAALTLSLISCDNEVQDPQNKEGKMENYVEQQTVFSTGNDATRTWMDDQRKFYWTTGDQIWIETSSGNWTMTNDSKLSNDQATADFYISGKLEALKYNLVFTGSGSTSAKTVTIKDAQAQTEWDNAQHIGESGDCGVDSAERQPTGNYKFSLKHKAAYLIFQPYKPDRITDGWKLMKIEVIADDGKALCGIYPFGMSGLDTDNATSTGTLVTLTLGGTAGLEIPNATTVATARKNCFAVIQPGSHEITIRYYIQPTGTVNGVAGGTFTIDKKIAARPYNANGVTTIRHELNVNATYSPLLFYMWDAENHYWYGIPYANIPKKYGASATGYPSNASDANRRWYNNTASAPTPASNSCKNMPNANAISWYVMAGDPRWENNYSWFFDGNEGADIITFGAWILKKEHISGFDTTVSYDGTTDLISTTKDYGNNSTSYQYGGRPSDSELGKYFFLPALARVSNGLLRDFAWGPLGAYWSSSPRPSGGTSRAYYLDFDASSINAANLYPQREIARVVAPDWFQ